VGGGDAGRAVCKCVYPRLTITRQDKTIIQLLRLKYVALFDLKFRDFINFTRGNNSARMQTNLAFIIARRKSERGREREREREREKYFAMQRRYFNCADEKDNVTAFSRSLLAAIKVALCPRATRQGRACCMPLAGGDSTIP